MRYSSRAQYNNIMYKVYTLLVNRLIRFESKTLVRAARIRVIPLLRTNCRYLYRSISIFQRTKSESRKAVSIRSNRSFCFYYVVIIISGLLTLFN